MRAANSQCISQETPSADGTSIRWASHLNRISVVLVGIGQADLRKRQHQVRLLLRPVEIIRNFDFVIDLERLVRLCRIAYVEIGNLSVNPTEAVHLLYPLIPLVPWNVPEEHSQVQLSVATKLVLHVGIQFSKFINF